MNRQSIILISSLLASTILSDQANPFNNVKELDQFLPSVEKYKSIPSPRTFIADSSRTAAGVLHYAIDEKKVPFILLGLRNDEDTYCNLGGKSDEAEDNAKGTKNLANEKKVLATLAQTASRETEEESNGYYAHHPCDLENQPFIDVLRKRKLYRMYWKKVQKIDGTILLKALEKGKADHNKEYKSFLWVPVRDLITSLENGNAKIQLGKDQEITLYEPLFQTLSTDSGFAFLRAIAKENSLSHFKKELHPYFNRLYIIRDENNELSEENFSSGEEDNNPSHAEFTPRWILPKITNIQQETLQEKLPSGKTVLTYKVHPVPFGQNAWGEIKQDLEIQELKHILERPISPEKDQKKFAHAVAAHGAAMVELKHKANKIRKKSGIEEENDTSSQFENIDGWNPKAELTLSRIHLRIVLGKDFKTPEDFKNAANPQRAADIANLRTYLTTHKDVEYTQKHVEAEFKRNINFSDHDLEILADVLAWEEQHKQHPAFYHAANADINNIWHSFTHLRELLSLSPLVGQKIALRGTDIYFRDIKIMQDILTKYGQHDYTADGKQNLVLCANYVLTAGLTTTRTTSSSIEYFLNNHSVDAPDVEGKFNEATALAGIIGKYAYFQSPFYQFLAHRHPTFENSVLVGISAPSYLLPKNTGVDPCGSKMFTQTNSTTLDVFKAIQTEYDTHKDTLEPFEQRKEEKRDLIPEARLSLHPNFAFHQDVHMKAFNRFPLNESEQKQFENEMRRATIGTLGDWLASHYKVMPDSFVQYPSLKTLYHYAYKGIMGRDVEEKFAAESFFHLVEHGHVNGVKEFIKMFPEIINHKNINFISLAYSILRTNKYEMLKYLCEEKLFQKVHQELFGTAEKFYKAIRTCLTQDAAKCLDYLLSQYDLVKIPHDLVKVWSNAFNESTIEPAGIFLKYFPQQTSSVLKRLFKEYVSEDQLEKLFANGINPQAIAETFLLEKQQSSEHVDLTSFYNFIEKHKVDLNNFKGDLQFLFKNDIQDDHIEKLIANGLNPQSIAEAYLTHLDEIQLEENPIYARPFFEMLSKHKIDLSNFKNLKQLFEKCYICDSDLHLLCASGISSQAIAETLLEIYQEKVLLGKDSDLRLFFNFIAKHKVDLSNFKNFKTIFDKLNFYSNELELLCTSGVSSQAIAEILLEFYQERILLGKDSNLQPFFAFIDKHKVDLSNFKNLKLLFEKRRLYSDNLESLCTSGVSPQAIAEALLATYPENIRSQKDLDVSPFFLFITKHKVNLSNLTNFSFLLTNQWDYRRDIEDLITCGANLQTIIEELLRLDQEQTLSSLKVDSLLTIIAKHKLDLKNPHTQTKIPLVFHIMHLPSLMTNSYLPSDFKQYFYTNLPSLAELKDSEGKTLFDHVQLAFKLKKYNALLNLITPFKLCETANRSEDYYNYDLEKPWYDLLVQAITTNDNSKITELIEKRPPFLDKERITPHLITHKIKYDQVQLRWIEETTKYALPQKIQDIITEQEKILGDVKKTLQDNNFKEFYTLWNSFPELIRARFEYNEISSKSLDKNKEPYLETVNSTLAAAVSKAPSITPISTDTSKDQAALDLAKKVFEREDKQLDTNWLKSQLDSFSNPKILRTFLGTILNLDDPDLTLEVLKLAYPNKNEFISLTETNIHSSSIFCAHPITYVSDKMKSLSALLEYVGNQFTDLALALGNDNFKHFLQRLTAEDARYLIAKHPNIFTYSDERNNFFEAAVSSLPHEVRSEFLLSHKEKLQDLSPKILKNILGTILKFNDYGLSLDVLKRAYPNIDEFIALKKTKGINEIASFHPLKLAVFWKYDNAVMAILEYIGNHFPDFVHMHGEKTFEQFLEMLPVKITRGFVKSYPELFTSMDEKNDFFDVSIKRLPFKVRNEFILSHKDKLKEISKVTGVPYFFTLGLGYLDERKEEETISLISELMKIDSSLGEVKSIDGFTLLEFSEKVLGETKFCKKIMKNLGN